MEDKVSATAESFLSLDYFAARRIIRGSGVGIATAGLPHAYFGYVLRGEGIFTSGDRTITVCAGELICIPPRLRYRSNWENAEFISVEYSFSRRSSAIGRANPIHKCRYPLQKLSDQDGRYRAEFTAMVDEYVSGDDGVLLAYGRLCRLYTQLRSVMERGGDDNSNPVWRAAAYIDDNCAADFTVADLASMCGLSESRFFHLFKSVVGMTPTEYKNLRRVNRAAELLREGRTAEEICSALNFSSPVYFRRVFKSATGTTPGEYRRRIT